MICGGMRGRFFTPTAEVCLYIAESPFVPLPTFLSGERKVYKRSAFSAPRAFRRGDAFRKAADGFRQIGERTVRDNASFCSRRLSVAHEQGSLAPLGARMGFCGSIVSILPHGIRALRRECVRGAALGLSADRRKVGALWRERFAVEALSVARGDKPARALRRPIEGGRLGRLNCSRCVPLCAVGEGLAPPVPYVIEQTNASLREGGGTAKP